MVPPCINVFVLFTRARLGKHGRICLDVELFILLKKKYEREKWENKRSGRVFNLDGRRIQFKQIKQTLCVCSRFYLVCALLVSKIHLHSHKS